MLQILYRGNAPSTEGMTSAAARAARSPSVTGTTIRTNASSLRCLSAASSGSSSAEVYEHRGRSQGRRTLFFKRSLMNPLVRYYGMRYNMVRDTLLRGRRDRRPVQRH